MQTGFLIKAMVSFALSSYISRYDDTLPNNKVHEKNPCKAGEPFWEYPGFWNYLAD